MKPYATSFTFDPADGTIWYQLDNEPDRPVTVFAMISAPQIPRQAATARLLADSPGALVECVKTLNTIVEYCEAEASPLALSVSRTAFAAILRAEKVLGIEKEQP